MKIKVFYNESDVGWGLGESMEIYNLVKKHYNAPEHLKFENINDIKLPCFVIYADKKCNSDSIVGVSFFTPITEHLIRIYRTVIRPFYRNKGHGTRLNKTMEREFKKKKFKKITCSVYTDNMPSLALKLKMNYTIEGTLRDHDGPGMDEYVLGKFL